MQINNVLNGFVSCVLGLISMLQIYSFNICSQSGCDRVSLFRREDKRVKILFCIFVVMKVNNGHRTILLNFFSLGLLQGANCLVPVLAIPFIVRALGVEAFGNVTYAQGIVQYFTILINYGFDYSATRQIAIHRDDSSKRSEIFWAVISAKFVLLVIAVSLFCLLASFSERIAQDPTLYILLFLINLGYVLFPTWFFQGVEEMGKMAVINFIIKVLGTGLPVFLVAAPSDYLIYAAMPSVAYVVMGIAAFFYAKSRYGLKLPMAEELRKERDAQFKLGFPVFLNTLFAALYTIANLTILGLFNEDYDLGIYSGAYKIISAIMMVTSMPIHMAIFPTISRRMEDSFEKGWAYYKRMVGVVFLYAALVTVVVYLSAPWMVQILLGDKFIDSIPLLKIMSVLPALVTIASMFTVQGLYGLGFQRYAPLVGMAVGVSCVALNFVLIPRWGGSGAACAWIVAEVMEILISGIIVAICIRKLERKSY